MFYNLERKYTMQTLERRVGYESNSQWENQQNSKKIVLNLYSIVPRVLSYLSLWVGERAWERGCIKERERGNRKQPRCKKIGSKQAIKMSSLGTVSNGGGGGGVR